MTGAPLDTLLARLKNVRQSGDRYRADCPIGHRSRGTLSIGETSDGNVLMCCHAGCGAAEVLAALGLSLADLFPGRPIDDRGVRTPADRRAQRERSRMYQVRRLLPELALEARIVLAAAAVLGRGERLHTEDDDRLVEAVGRIQSAREVLR